MTSLHPTASTTPTNFRIVSRADAARVVAELKAADGGGILTFGSRTTWNALAGAGLVDELHLIVGAKVVGSGTPLFGGELSGTSLRLVDVERRQGSSNVVLPRARGPLTKASGYAMAPRSSPATRRTRRSRARRLW